MLRFLQIKHNIITYTKELVYSIIAHKQEYLYNI